MIDELINSLNNDRWHCFQTKEYYRKTVKDYRLNDPGGITLIVTGKYFKRVVITQPINYTFTWWKSRRIIKALNNQQSRLIKDVFAVPQEHK